MDERYKEKLAGFNVTGPDSVSSIQLTEYKPNHLTYKYSANCEQLAVFSEIFYDKGWHAFIDGNPADYFRANYILRAMKVPAGNHTLEFKFEPQVVFTGEKISFAGSILILLMAGIACWMELKKKPQTD